MMIPRRGRGKVPLMHMCVAPRRERVGLFPSRRTDEGGKGENESCSTNSSEKGGGFLQTVRKWKGTGARGEVSPRADHIANKASRATSGLRLFFFFSCSSLLLFFCSSLVHSFLSSSLLLLLLCFFVYPSSVE